ncbi:hypothetical protein [Aeromicrobium stalagmiti]|uniref:hypothetical protein n=1 Tax=Aeromicrobium stalagmiti TaxID=2738988 RepID=UPI0015682879|nr:hypothetical protein [Aeromicrobium stalagmiti]NRQ51023.1 hypothetical protein [Aeromicrobium stalagmiti]
MTGPGPTADATSASASSAEPVGSIAEEAFKLFRAVASAPHASTAAPETPKSDHVCSTSWCPVCQVVGFVRDNPEALASVTQSAAAFARSLRDLVDTALAPQEEK